MNRNQAAILASLVVSAMFTGWLLHSQDMYQGPTGISDHGPDIFVKGMHIDVMDETGTLQYRIQAETMKHYPNSDQITLTNPVLQLFAGNELIWHIVSQNSALDDKGEIVKLLGEVRIRREKTNEKHRLDVLTRDLVVRPDSKTADTEHRAIIQSDRYTIEGTGMHADFTTNRLEINSQAKGRFDVAG